MDDLKAAAAARALTYIQPGMKLGLGTGSTAEKFVALLGDKVKGGMDVLCVATSLATERQAVAAGLRLATLDDEPLLDLVVDGADEIDGQLRVIKGGGGALLREKIVAAASEQLIIIADHTKLVPALGAFPLAVEVVPFGLAATRIMVEEMAEDAGCQGDIVLRLGADGKPFVTDGGHYILDCKFGRIDNPELLDDALRYVPGLVETGLFLGLADLAIVAGPDGVTELEALEAADHDNDG
jgi:ribose 5-phosphate isomerase A